jgi:hypothetical protein
MSVYKLKCKFVSQIVFLSSASIFFKDISSKQTGTAKQRMQFFDLTSYVKIQVQKIKNLEFYAVLNCRVLRVRALFLSFSLVRNFRYSLGKVEENKTRLSYMVFQNVLNWADIFIQISVIADVLRLCQRQQKENLD